MAHDGKTQREAATRTPAPGVVERTLPPKFPAAPIDKKKEGPPALPNGAARDNASAAAGEEATPRRPAKRRPAGVPRSRVAANDDVPSIGGLIFALQQKPS